MITKFMDNTKAKLVSLRWQSIMVTGFFILLVLAFLTSISHAQQLQIVLSTGAPPPIASATGANYIATQYNSQSSASTFVALSARTPIDAGIIPRRTVVQ